MTSNLEYIESKHLYLYKGVIIPSVTQILGRLFPNKYKGIPESILRNKADYGTKVHKIIEDLENNKEYDIDSEYIKISIDQYKKLKEKNNIKVIEQEKLICYEGIYAGRFDMIATIGEYNCLCDIKTTAQLDKEYLSWQLSLYELGYGKKFDKFYVIWLPKKGLAELIEIERIDKKEIEKLLEELKSERIKSRRQSTT